MTNYYEQDQDHEAMLLADAIIEDSGTAKCGHRIAADEVCTDCQRCIDCCICPGELIRKIKEMPREHLENLAEYIVRQRYSGLNSAPDILVPIEKLIWVKGFEYSREVLVELLADPGELVDRLPGESD